MNPLCFASLPVYDTGETWQGVMRHLSFAQCSSVPALLPSAAAASLCCAPPGRECGDNMFSTDSAAGTGIQCRAEGGSSCDSNTSGLKSRKEGENARLGHRGQTLRGEELRL